MFASAALLAAGLQRLVWSGGSTPASLYFPGFALQRSQSVASLLDDRQPAGGPFPLPPASQLGATGQDRCFPGLRPPGLRSGRQGGLDIAPAERSYPPPAPASQLRATEVISGSIGNCRRNVSCGTGVKPRLAASNGRLDLTIHTRATRSSAYSAFEGSQIR